MHKLILAIVGFAAVAALWAGCGGGSDDQAGAAGDTTATLTKAQFVKKASAICAERREEWSDVVAPARKELQAADGSINEKKVEELVTGSLVPLMQEELEKLEALGVPAGDEKTVNAMLKSRSQAIADIEADTGAISSSESLTNFATEAREYGVQCPL